jgi:photosystem II stability/assembly factor-like uncharacterized protein
MKVLTSGNSILKTSQILRSWDHPEDRLRIIITGADVDSNNNVYVGYPRATILKSTDGGNKWEIKYELPGDPLNVSRIFCDSRNYVFASGGGSSDYGLYRSTDGGTNFARVIEMTGGFVWGIDEDSLGNLYAGEYVLGSSSVIRIWKSTDGGSVWSIVFERDDGVSGNQHVHDLRIHPVTGYIYATIGDSTSDKILRSKDNGATWTVVLTGGQQLLAMAVLGNYVYVGSDVLSGNKIYRFTDDGGATISLSEMRTLDADGDGPLFFGGETASKVFFGVYKEYEGQGAKIYVYDGSTWTTPYSEAAEIDNHGFVTCSRKSYNETFFVSNRPNNYGIKFVP